MMRRRLALIITLFFVTAVALTACATMGKLTAENFQAPVVTLESFEVPQYDGYWYYAATVKATKGSDGDHGAPLPMSFLLSIKNPNPYPILLESITYTVAFDKDFDLYSGNDSTGYWIPAGMTDHVRLNTMITVRSALMSVLVTGGFKLKAKGWSPWDALQRWWEGVPNMTVPVTLKETSLSFKADGVLKVIPFEATIQ
jgi:hypothetical protein